jgi:hypothetical protein
VAAARLASRVSGQRHDFLIGFLRLVEYNLNERTNLMKKLISYTLTAFLATIAISFAAPDNNKEGIISKEKAAWQAFKDKKADEFKKLVSADLVTVYADGMHSMQEELDMMAKTDMKSFSLSDFNVTFAGPDTAMITYKATVQSTSAGKDTSGTYNAGSVWRMTNGQWQAIFHTDAKVAPPTSPAG